MQMAYNKNPPTYTHQLSFIPTSNAATVVYMGFVITRLVWIWFHPAADGRRYEAYQSWTGRISARRSCQIRALSAAWPSCVNAFSRVSVHHGFLWIQFRFLDLVQLTRNPSSWGGSDYLKLIACCRILNLKIISKLKPISHSDPSQVVVIHNN